MNLKWSTGMAFAGMSVFSLTAEVSTNSTAVPDGPLTLTAAIGRTITEHPELAAHQMSLRINDARVLQAGLRPNPELFMEAENVLGSGSFSGAKQAEITVGITQVVQLWGRRKKRINAASGGRGLAQRDYESARLRIAAVTASRFIRVVVARESVQLAKEAVEMAEEYHTNLLLRAESGQGSKVEESRSIVDVERARMGLVLARKRLEAASLNLSAQWGGNFADLEVAGNLSVINPAPDLAELQRLVQSHPDVLRWAAEQERVRRSLAYEQVNARPDVAVGAGYRWLNGPDDSAFVFSASIPLPTFNRNQGNILEAELNLDRAGDLETTALWRIRADLAHVWNRLLIAQTEVESIRDRLLPVADDARREAAKSHDVARLSYLDVFETRRTYYQIKQRLLGALAEFHLARVELDALIGTLPGVPTTSPQP